MIIEAPVQDKPYVVYVLKLRDDTAVPFEIIKHPDVLKVLKVVLHHHVTKQCFGTTCNSVNGISLIQNCVFDNRYF